MSFSCRAKEDLAKIKIRTRGARLAQLSGLTLTCGALYVGRGRGVTYATESLAVGKQILALAGNSSSTLPPDPTQGAKGTPPPLNSDSLTDALRAAVGV